MIAGNTTAFFQVAHQVDTFIGMWSVANQITQTDTPVDVPVRGITQQALQGLKVTVDIRKDQQSHSVSLLRPALACFL